MEIISNEKRVKANIEDKSLQKQTIWNFFRVLPEGEQENMENRRRK